MGLEYRTNNHPIALHVDDVEAARAELESRGVEFRADTIDVRAHLVLAEAANLDLDGSGHQGEISQAPGAVSPSSATRSESRALGQPSGGA